MSERSSPMQMEMEEAIMTKLEVGSTSSTVTHHDVRRGVKLALQMAFSLFADLTERSSDSWSTLTKEMGLYLAGRETINQPSGAKEVEQ